MGLHAQHGLLVRLFTVLFALLLALPAAAQCRLALVLALDISSSVDEREYYLQQEGLARALESPAVRDAFLPGLPPVALSIFEWSGSRQQNVIQDWVLIDTPERLDEVAQSIRVHPRSAATQPTAIGNALLFSYAMLQRAPDCDQWTVDVSGDGINNDGAAPNRAYAQADWTGITVNALAIGNGPQMETYYLRQVARGFRSFVERAERFEDFGDAIERKLIREVLPEMMLGMLE